MCAKLCFMNNSVIKQLRKTAPDKETLDVLYTKFLFYSCYPDFTRILTKSCIYPLFFIRMQNNNNNQIIFIRVYTYIQTQLIAC